MIARQVDRVVPGRRSPSARRRWAYSLIRRTATPPPFYGSAEWAALPDDSPSKVAAVVVAAECWAQAGDTLEDDLRREVDSLRRAHKQAEDDEYRARADEHRREWAAPTRGSFAERRRAQLDAVAPRDGDYPGGPVPWLPKPRNRWDELCAAAEPELMCDADCGVSLVVDPYGCGDGCRATNRRQVAT